MLVADGNISQYNELLNLSIEDYIIRFKMFIEDLITRHERAKNEARQR